MEMRFIGVDDPLYDAECALRSKVLREPLGFSRGAEQFPFEGESLHLVAIDDGVVVGCLLFHPEEKTGRLFQMAILPERQGGGIGKQLINYMEEALRLRGYTSVYLHARKPVVTFYELLDYVAEGDPFTEIGIEHQKMVKVLV